MNRQDNVLKISFGGGGGGGRERGFYDVEIFQKLISWSKNIYTTGIKGILSIVGTCLSKKKAKYGILSFE